MQKQGKVLQRLAQQHGCSNNHYKRYVASSVPPSMMTIIKRLYASHENLQKNIARDFPSVSSHQQTTLPPKGSSINLSAPFDDLKRAGYETRGDQLAKRISFKPSTVPSSMTVFSMLTSLPMIVGSGIFAASATPKETTTTTVTTTTTTSAAQASSEQTQESWVDSIVGISHDALINYQLNYAALLLVAYGGVHLGLNYGAYHAPPRDQQVIVDTQYAAEVEKKKMEEQALQSKMVSSETNRDRADFISRSQYSPDSSTGWKRMVLALYPIGIAFASLGVPVLPASVFLMLGHIVSAAVDISASYQGLAPIWYPAMRFTFCLIVCASLALSVFFYIFTSAMETIEKKTEQLNQTTVSGASQKEGTTTTDGEISKWRSARQHRPKIDLIEKKESDLTASKKKGKTHSEDDDDEDFEDDIDFEAELKKIKM